jgi:large subunit ribosomal protein L49
MDRRFRQNTKIDTSKIPYAVNRTSSGNLPVYSKVRGIDRDTYTYIESVYGDSNAFISDLRMTICGDSKIKEQGRTIEISGRFAKQVKSWLQSLGF